MCRRGSWGVVSIVKAYWYRIELHEDAIIFSGIYSQDILYLKDISAIYINFAKGNPRRALKILSEADERNFRMHDVWIFSDKRTVVLKTIWFSRKDKVAQFLANLVERSPQGSFKAGIEYDRDPSFTLTPPIIKALVQLYILGLLLSYFFS